MRRVTLMAALLLLVCAVALAEEKKPNAIYAFVTNPGFTRINHDSRWDGALGVALQRMFTPHVSGEVTVSRTSHLDGFTTFNADGSVRESHIFTAHSTPVDLTARYHFFTDSSWKPYAGLGMRFMDSRTFVDLTGGVVWQFHRTLGLRFDGKLLGGQTRFNDQLNGSVGLSWRF